MLGVRLQKEGAQLSRSTGTESHKGRGHQSYLPLTTVNKSWRLNINCRAVT